MTNPTQAPSPRLITRLRTLFTPKSATAAPVTPTPAPLLPMGRTAASLNGRELIGALTFGYLQLSDLTDAQRNMVAAEQHFVTEIVHKRPQA